MTDQQLISLLQEGGKPREKAFNHLIREFSSFVPKVAQSTGLSMDQAKDAFTDALLALNEQVLSGKFNGQSKLSTYFYQIFYFKSVDFFRKTSTNKVDFVDKLPETIRLDSDTIKDLQNQESFRTIVNYLDQLGNPCKQILLEWGYWGYKIHEIAGKLGEDPEKLKKKKYRCLQQLRKLVGSSKLE
ncbi:MAG: sigma-70 family RNA polymerase sigma factor [Bacteroidota bacterium]